MGAVLLQLDRFLQHIIKYSVMKAITQTDFNFRHQTGKYEGKVRDVYTTTGYRHLMSSCQKA